MNIAAAVLLGCIVSVSKTSDYIKLNVLVCFVSVFVWCDLTGHL